jgi:hypothetical protein
MMRMRRGKIQLLITNKKKKKFFLNKTIDDK